MHTCGFVSGWDVVNITNYISFCDKSLRISLGGYSLTLWWYHYTCMCACNVSNVNNPAV